MVPVFAVLALFTVCHVAGFKVVKSVSAGNANLQMADHRNVGQLSNDHETINEKLDKLLDMFGEKMVEDNIRSVTETVNQLEMSIATMQTEISLLQESVSNINTKMLKTGKDIDQIKQERDTRLTHRGTTYIRWGRTECPKNGSELVYQGFAGGSRYDHMGAASSMLCLPTEPKWAKFDDKEQTHGGCIYGTEYRAPRGNKLFQTETYLQDVPCAVCFVTNRPVSIMIPATTSCYPGWSLEYRGYLMSGRYDHAAASDYYCIDASPEKVSGGSADQLRSYLLYFVEGRCGSLQCPPYVHERELACVVCSK